MSRRSLGCLLALVLVLAPSCGTSPERTGELLDEGDRALEAGRLEEAARLFEEAARLEPDNARAAIGLGLARLRSGDPAAAIDHFGKAGRLDPGNPLVLYLHASALSAAGRTEEAIAAYRTLLAAQPDHSQGASDLSDLLLAGGDPQVAKEVLLDALERSPRHFGLLVRTGHVLVEVGEAEAALPFLEQARRSRPYALEPVYELISANHALGREDRSLDLMNQYKFLEFRQQQIDRIRKRVEEAPSDREAAEAYIRALLGDARYEEAIHATEVFLARFPDGEDRGALAVGAARVAATMGDHDTARRLLRSAGRGAERSPEDMLTSAEILSALGDTMEAVSIYEDYLASNPDDAGALVGLGQASMMLGDYQRAEENLRRAVEKDPKNAEALASLGILLVRRGMTDEARSNLSAALDLSPDQPDALFGMSMLAHDRGDFNEARRLIEGALEQQPLHQGMNALYGLIVSRQGNCEEAIPLLRYSLQLDPESVDLHAALVTCYEETGRPEMAAEARAEARKALGPR